MLLFAGLLGATACRGVPRQHEFGSIPRGMAAVAAEDAFTGDGISEPHLLSIDGVPCRIALPAVLAPGPRVLKVVSSWNQHGRCTPYAEAELPFHANADGRYVLRSARQDSRHIWFELVDLASGKTEVRTAVEVVRTSS